MFISVLAVAAGLSGSMAQTPEELYKEAGTWLFLEQEAGFGDALARFQALKPESAKKDCLLGLLEGQLLHAMQDARGAANRLGPVEREARALTHRPAQSDGSIASRAFTGFNIGNVAARFAHHGQQVINFGIGRV